MDGPAARVVISGPLIPVGRTGKLMRGRDHAVGREAFEEAGRGRELGVSEWAPVEEAGNRNAHTNAARTAPHAVDDVGE